MLLRSTGEDAYFAASNSAKGFFSYYSACFDHVRIDHLYAVKGGPGTGKSRFLRDVADCGRRAGWSCEHIYCSSDPDSLDGVILSRAGRGIALLDATAPHVYEPILPGTREDLVNLGVFWDREALEGQRRQIQRLQKQKGDAYRRAYHYLAAAGELSEARSLLIEPYIRTDAIFEYAREQMQSIGGEDSFSVQTALMGSLGMRGKVYLDTYLTRAKELTLIEDCRGTGYRLIEELLRLARERHCRVRVSYHPLMPQRPDAIAFLQSGKTFAVAPGRNFGTLGCRISMRRFLDSIPNEMIGREAGGLSRSIRTMCDGAEVCMRDVREAHFALEEIYSATMNFDAKETFTKIFCRELFGLQSI